MMEATVMLYPKICFARRIIHIQHPCLSSSETLTGNPKDYADIASNETNVLHGNVACCITFHNLDFLL